MVFPFSGFSIRAVKGVRGASEMAIFVGRGAGGNSPSGPKTPGASGKASKKAGREIVDGSRIELESFVERRIQGPSPAAYDSDPNFSVSLSFFVKGVFVGKRAVQLRLEPPKNGQRSCINLAEDYEFDGAVAQ